MDSANQQIASAKSPTGRLMGIALGRVKRRVSPNQSQEQGQNRSQYLCLLLLVLITLLMPAHAAWLDAHGSAEIINEDIDRARNEAISQAINYATLQTGVSIQSQQQISNGQLISDNLAITRDWSASNIKLISETISGNTLNVHLQIAVTDNSAAQCVNQNIKAAIFIPATAIKDRRQLNQGRLAGLGPALSRRLARQLDTLSRTAFSHLHAQDYLDTEINLTDRRSYRLPTWLLNNTDSQYLLLPVIEDISLQPSANSWLSWFSAGNQRIFRLHLSLYHGISGEMLWQEHYQLTADWPFSPTQHISPDSDRFWLSDYGRSIDKLLGNAAKDIDTALLCRPVLGQIIAMAEQQIVVNLGRKNGLKTGDTLTLIQKQSVRDRLSQIRTQAHAAGTSVTVEQLSETSASATLNGPASRLALQLNDIVTKE